MPCLAPLRHLMAAATLAFAAIGPACASEALPLITLRIGDARLSAEVAAAEDSRVRGLMFRKQPLAEDRGMLFVFLSAGFHSMWMKNTYIPLSVAFIDDNGIILNIADMAPHTTNTHPAAGFARYALEMNQGWFAKRGIRAGARIEGLQAAPAPR